MVRPNHGVTIEGGRLIATYGVFTLSTPLSNIRGGHVTEDYSWYKALGVRLSLADDGLTFGTTDRRGVCIHFRDKVGGVVPFRDHSALTVTVRDCEELVGRLGQD